MSSRFGFNAGHLSWYVFRFPNRPSGWQDPRDWLVQKAQGPWSIGVNSHGSTIPFFVRDKRDAMMFKLTWFNDTAQPVFR